MHHAGQRLWNHERHGSFFMLLEHFGQGRLHAFLGLAEHFALGGADDSGLLLPLAINLGLLTLYVFDQHTLPKAMVDVVQGVELL